MVTDPETVRVTSDVTVVVDVTVAVTWVTGLPSGKVAKLKELGDPVVEGVAMAGPMGPLSVGIFDNVKGSMETDETDSTCSDMPS